MATKHNKEFKGQCIYLGDNIELDALYIGNECLYQVEKPETEDNNVFQFRVSDDCTGVVIRIESFADDKLYECEPGSIFTMKLKEPLQNCWQLFDRGGGEDNKIVEIIKLPDTSLCTMFYRMFYCSHSLESVNLENVDTRNVINMSGMFDNCTKLTHIDVSRFNTEKCTDMSNMFNFCSALLSLDLSSFDLSNDVGCGDMFAWDSNLQELKFSIFNLSNQNHNKSWGIFYYTPALKDVTGIITNLKDSISLSHSPLTRESALVFINGTSSVNTTQTLTFSSYTYSQLTDEDIAIATARGWSVAKS